MPSGIPGRGLIIDKESLIPVSNVALIDPVEKLATKIKWCEVVDADNITRSARISLRSGVEIPIPKYVPKKRYGIIIFVFILIFFIEGNKDTPPELVTQRSFHPNLNVCPVPLDCHVY